MTIKKSTIKYGALALGLTFFMASCDNSGSNQEATTDDSVQVDEATDDAANKLNDAQIAHIAVTANQIDIDYANIAKEKATNPDVKKFAETMATDHQNVIDLASDLAEKLGVVPEDNPTSQSLLDGEKEATAKLNAAEGADFDKAYIDNEVAYHDAVIGAVEDVLIPNISNQELKDLITGAVPLFKEHLEHAKKIQAELEK